MIEKIKSLFAKKQQPNAPRFIRAGYDAARTTRHNENYYKTLTSGTADQEATPSIRAVLRSRARHEYMNNGYCRGMLDTKARYVFGTTPKINFMTSNDGLNQYVEDLFMKWAQEIKLGYKLRSFLVSKYRDGDGFLNLFTNPKLKHEVKLDLRPIDGARITQGYGSEWDENHFDGIDFDSYGNPTTYHVYPTTFGGILSGFGKPIKISTANMIHYFTEVLPEQHRGVSDIAPALMLFGDLRQYTQAIIRAAKMAANFTGVLESNSDEITPVNFDTASAIDYEMDCMLTLPGGWKMHQMDAGNSPQQYQAVKPEIINEIARCISMPRNIALGNSSEYNYSSGQLDHGDFEKSIQAERFDIIYSVLEKIFSAWYAEAQLITVDGRNLLPPLDTAPRHRWLFDGMIHGDPVKSAKAAETRIASGISSKSIEISSTGFDPDIVFESRAQDALKEKLAREKYGVTDELEPAKPERNAEPEEGGEDEDE